MFDGTKKMDVSMPKEVAKLGDLIKWVKNNLVKEKHDMFVLGDTLRPGVLVLVNDVDWELENTTEYVLEKKDQISFISTLHGG